jgi:hypothetical protein
MAIKSEPSSKSTRLSVWVLAACALAAAVVALMLAWQNAELESELNALKREKPIGGASISLPASSEQPVQGLAATTNASADAPKPQGGQPMSLLDALRASEQAAKNKPNDTSAVYPFEPKKQ